MAITLAFILNKSEWISNSAGTMPQPLTRYARLATEWVIHIYDLRGIDIAAMYAGPGTPEATKAPENSSLLWKINFGGWLVL
jgi:hypothetical protein